MKHFATLILAALAALPVAGQTLPVLVDAPGIPATATSIYGSGFDVGDVTGDGVPDFAVVRTDPGSPAAPLAVELRSGATGLFVRSLLIGSAFSTVILSVRGFGDLDGDGFDEVAITSRDIGFFGTPTGTQLRIIDGAGGLPWWVVNLTTFPGYFEPARDVVRLSDITGDGIDDLAVLIFGNPPTNPNNPIDATPTRIYWLNGATSAFIHEIFDASRIVTTIANAGDADADGFDDLLICAPTSSVIAPNAGGVALVSGATFQYLHFWGGTTANAFFGNGAVAAGDVNGDGHDDVMICSQVADLARVYSGLDGSQLQSFGLGIGGAYSAHLLDVPTFDWNGDGVTDRFLRTLGGPALHEVRSGVDFSTLAATDDILMRDVNGDALPETLEVVPGPMAVLTPSLRILAHKGAEPYGAGSGGLALGWQPYASTPGAGLFHLSGGSPGASVLIGGSTQASNALIGGTTFPLLISVQPNELFLNFAAVLNAFGELAVPVDLAQPALAGTVLYYQWAQLGPTPGTSNGLQLLFAGA